MTLSSKQPARGKQLNCCNCKLLRNDLEIGNKQIGSVPDLVENIPDRWGLMGVNVNESSDSSSSSALSASSTSSSDEETDSEQNTTRKHVTSQDVYNEDQGEEDGISDDGTSTKVDGSVALDSINADVGDAAPSDSETLQIQESSRYCRLPSWRNTVPSWLAQLIYHELFTSFQGHGALLDKDKSLAKNILLQLQRLKIIPKNNNHIMQHNQEVLLWSKPIAKKPPLYGYDDNVGDDCLSSQSSYDQDISNQDFLHSIIPSSQYLAYSTIDVTAELKGIYSSLFQAIHKIQLKPSDKTTLLVIDEKWSIVNTHIAQIKASSVVHAYNNIELFDWERGNQSHSLWYCDDTSKPPMLKSAIDKALKKLCHSQASSRLFSKESASTQYQFMGFVSSHTKEGNYLVGFHPSLFVIFWTDLKYSNTIVIYTLTSCHHTLSNMQDQLLQLLQIFQYLHHNIKFQLLITNNVFGDDVTLQYWSWLAYSSMGFDTSTLTQDCYNIGFLE